MKCSRELEYRIKNYEPRATSRDKGTEGQRAQVHKEQDLKDG